MPRDLLAGQFPGNSATDKTPGDDDHDASGLLRR